jgi:hypothetical protein
LYSVSAQNRATEPPLFKCSAEKLRSFPILSSHYSNIKLSEKISLEKRTTRINLYFLQLFLDSMAFPYMCCSLYLDCIALPALDAACLSVRPAVAYVCFLLDSALFALPDRRHRRHSPIQIASFLKINYSATFAERVSKYCNSIRTPKRMQAIHRCATINTLGAAGRELVHFAHM